MCYGRRYSRRTTTGGPLSTANRASPASAAGTAPRTAFATCYMIEPLVELYGGCMVVLKV